MTKINNIAKNTSYLTIALILQKVISFAYFAFLARNLGPENLGKYYFAISFTTIFAIFIDLGFINFLTREVAKKQEAAEKLLGNILSVKVFLTFLTTLVVILTINLLHYDQLIKDLVYISIICMVLDSFSTTFFATIRGFHNLKYESISSIIFQLIVLIFGLAAMYLNLNLRLIIGSLVLASVYNFIYSFWVLRHRIKIKLKLLYEVQLIKSIFTTSLPFALFAIFQRLYTYLDSVFLSFMAGDYYVGLYQVAFKIIFALQFLPLAFTASLYPAMSTYWISNRPQLTIAFERAMNYLIIISLPIIFGVIMLADKIILIFRSDYSEATIPLQVTIVALFFIFVNFPIGSLLNACDRQRRNTLNMLIVMVVSIILNVILIPLFKATGAGITVLLTNLLMFILGIIWVKKIIVYSPKRNILVFMKALVASILMSLIIFWLKPFLPLVIITLLSMVIYFFLIYLLGGFKKADINYIIHSFKKPSSTPITEEII
ncbi:MAG: flippase [Patescibacteria group bacterium]